jgi:hypothetical protein
MSVVQKRNRYTGEVEFEVSGKIISIGNAIMRTKNSLKRPYRFAKVEIIYPNGTSAIGSSLLFETMRVRKPLDFSVNSEVLLRINQKGNSQILLSKKKYLKCLPLKIHSNLLWVKDEYRTNLLSFEPGGFCVIVEYTDGTVLGYDKIKFKELYVNKIILHYFKELNIEFLELTDENKKEMLKIYISSVYFGEYTDQNDYENVGYQLQWSKDIDEFLPWE